MYFHSENDLLSLFPLYPYKFSDIQNKLRFWAVEQRKNMPERGSEYTLFLTAGKFFRFSVEVLRNA